MIIQKDLRKLLHQLIKEEVAEISIGGSSVTVHVFDNATKIFLSSSVYRGENFIPYSVRNSISKKPPFTQGFPDATLALNEELSCITLNYVGRLDHLSKKMFVDLLEEFSLLADEWHLFLDEHDKNDLIYVRKPKN